MSFEQDLNNLNWQPENTIEGDGLPRISWLSKTESKGMVGKFYARAAQMPNLDTPWTAENLFDDEDGYTATRLELCIIRSRAQAYSETTTGSTRVRTWHPKYIAGQNMRIYTELLCLVKGLEYPVVWPVKGLVGRGVTAVRDPQSIMGRMREVEKEAKKTATAPIPSFAFWTPIKQPTDAKGKLVKTSTGYGSDVIVPVIDLPTEIDRSICAKLYVGGAKLEQAKQLWMEYAGWAQELRSNDATPTTARTEFDSEATAEPF